jgi:glyoxylase-like metal-dependent hydrolase (beta-lactamase superfamily II)
MIYHLNCGSLHPYLPAIDSLVNCLVLESDDGYILVDTGFGKQDYVAPSPLMRAFTGLLRTPRDLKETAIHQVQELGIDPGDVHHIILTHMHLDHAGGLPDFPWAKVHVHRAELEAAMRRALPLGPFYRPEHWAHNPTWVLYDSVQTKWFDFNAIEVLPGLTPRILLLPMPGHSQGHCGVAVELDDGWLLHCGDATYPFYHMDDPRQPYGEPPTWLVRWLLGPFTPKLKTLAQEHGDEVTLLCGHDPVSYMNNKSY